MLVDYRGFGKSEGEIKVGKDLFRDAEGAVEWLKKNKNYKNTDIILYGESIGSAPAIELATQAKFHSLVLEAPFTSVKELGKIHYGFAPDFLLKDFHYKNADIIGNAG